MRPPFLEQEIAALRARMKTLEDRVKRQDETIEALRAYLAPVTSYSFKRRADGSYDTYGLPPRRL